MESLSIIITIVVIIFVSVAGITFAQKKEQARAALVQQIAKYKYRANEAGRILENFAHIPIGMESRKLLLQYAQLNLQQASKLKPSDQSIKKNLSSIQAQLEAPSSPVDNQRLTIPSDTEQLNLILSKLSTLGKYLLKFQSINALGSANIALAVNRLNLLTVEIKITAYSQQAKKALANKDYVNAQRNFQIARNMLSSVAQKNNRLTKLEQEIIELSTSNVESSVPKTQEKGTKEEMKKSASSSESDDIFGPKKKW